VLALVTDSDLYTLDTSTTSLEPGAEVAVTVTFRGVTAGSFAGAAILTDEAGVTWRVSLTAAVDGNVDVDMDGVLSTEDCNDTDATVYPGAEDAWYDGVDSDCAGNNDFDQDEDGRLRAQDGGDDCNDEDATIYGGATEVWYDGIDQDCAGDDDFDQDGDGAQSADVGGTDCDDVDGTIFPGATETWYDGIDQDCAGDDDFDQDGDGDPVTAGDCDDTDPVLSSLATEICDGVDNDCDGLADEELPDVTSYLDADGDGYGLADSTMVTCTVPAGYAARSGDCDDTNAGRSPGLTEAAYNLLDDDCDLIQDEMDAETQSDWTITSLRANDGLGYGAMGIYDDLLDDGAVQVVACSPAVDYSSTVADVGACAVQDSGVRGDPASFTAGDIEIYGDSGGSDAFGAGFASLGDVDGDGYTDVVYSSYTDNRDDVGTSASGTVYFASLSYAIASRYTYLNAGSSSLAYYAYRESWQRAVEGIATNGNFGYALSAGDMDADGRSDIAVGAPGEESGKGRTYVLLHDDYTETDGDTTFRRTTTDNASYDVVGMGANDHLGYSVLLADINGDGYDDIISCAPDDDDGGLDSGSCWVDLGRSSVSVSNQTVLSQMDGYVFGTAANDQLGKTRHSLAAGDFDGDGDAELALGLPGYDGGGADGGAIAIWSNGTFTGGRTIAGATWLVLGDGALGTAVALPGDVDGDGTGDLLGGAPTAGGAGRVYLLSGGAAAGSWSVPGSQTGSWSGAASGDLFGTSLSNLADANADGRLDFVVGAPGSDTGASNAGKAYVIPAYP